MAYEIIRWWATLFLRMYFRRTIVYGREHIPLQGPLILASNHPSAFMEASVLGTVLGRPLHYLVRGDMFHPRFKWLFDWTHQIPIFRQKDGITNLRKNASTFDLTYRKLASGEAVLIFPEAKSLLEKKMRPIQRGTAHLAFGTLPYLKENERLSVLPVGVNFTDPRIPGTDVVIKFGKPFFTPQAAREDRVAIDQFTESLSNALDPLIIQIPDAGYERHYDVMASIYLRCLAGSRDHADLHDDLRVLSFWINEHETHQESLKEIHEHIHHLKRVHLLDSVYFPDIILTPRVLGILYFVYKLLWWLAGGWIWRLARHIIFLKIKANTFKAPVSLGVAMLLFPLVTTLFSIGVWVAGWPLWLMVFWLFVMWTGIVFRPPIELLWKSLTLKGKTRRDLKQKIENLKKEVAAIIGSSS